LISSCRIKEKPHQAVEIFRTLIEKANDGFTIIQDGKVVFVNSEICRTIGFSAEEIIGEPFIKFVSSQQVDLVSSLYKRRMAGEKLPDRYETELKHKDGNIIPVDINASIIEYEGRMADMAIIRNISDKKQAEMKIKEAERRYRLLAENAGDVIWTVNLQMCPTYISPSITRLLGYSVEEAMARPMASVFTPDSYKIAMNALAEEMAIEKLEHRDLSRTRTLDLELISKNDSIIPVEIKYSLLRDENGCPREILAIARDETRRRESEEQAKRSIEKLFQAMENTIQAIAMITEMRDPYTAGHQRQVAELACAIASELRLSQDQITGLRLTGLIHDIGKVRVPSEILTHPDGLSEAEFTIIKMHPALGYEILKTIEFPWPIAKAVYQHHERIDGSGYPLGLTGNEIILEAKILAVADVVEAIASHRPYRPARGINEALDEISKKKGKLYDSKVADACVKLFQEGKFKFISDQHKPFHRILSSDTASSSPRI
jgi:PAS domain S-box-containing protein/putative nucleotidyltransferase with HDIG domain